jgi:tetratricopeptide (TPR) repeat protein
VESEPRTYLDALAPDQRALVARVNREGEAKLHTYLESGSAIAFVGAGGSAPLYPLWDSLIAELISSAEVSLGELTASTCRQMARTDPDAVVELVRRRLGAPAYRETLRHLLRLRRDSQTGRTFTFTHELVVRCNFARVVTTNYDPGIVDARAFARPLISVTGFASYTNDDALDRWASNDVLQDAELPVLFAHGCHNEPDAVVLAATEYRRAYRGKLGRVLGHLVQSEHLVWLGFSFSDQRITAIIREIVDAGGTSHDPGLPPRHVAVVGWDPGNDAADPSVIREIMQIQHGCDVILYPAPSGDHSALHSLLGDFTDKRFPPVHDLPVASRPSVRSPTRHGDRPPGPLSEWVHGGQPLPHFTARFDELGRLDRWAADPEVNLIGVTAWGGSGKTALVTQWLVAREGATQRATRGVFAWSFYEDNSAEKWANTLLNWANTTFGLSVNVEPRASQVLALLAAVPLIIVLDGLEVTQEGPGGGDLGRLLDGILRDVLVGHCQQRSDSLAVLTSRFPFADLERFSGGSARMLDVPPFTADEGAEVLRITGAGWVSESERRALTDDVDGHALAVDALGRVLSAHPSTADLAALRETVALATRTDERVAKVLGFYADRLRTTDRLLVAWVSLFQRPVTVATILALATAEQAGSPAWTAARVEAAVRARLGGLLTWHPNSSISAHPLVRDTFRPMALSAGTASYACDLGLADLPGGEVANRADALRVVEMIELLLEAEQWTAAEDLYRIRTDDGNLFLRIPAARLGQRAAAAFVGTPGREQACRARLSRAHSAFYLNELGLFALSSGDLTRAIGFLEAAMGIVRDVGENKDLAVGLQNLAECRSALGWAEEAAASAQEALDLANLDDTIEISDILGLLGASYDLGGRTAESELAFIRADLVKNRETGDHLLSTCGTNWADFLIRSGRVAIAWRLTEQNQTISERNGRKDDIARCDRTLGRCYVADGNTELAESYLEGAIAAFRDGDLVTELVATLPDLAEQRRQMGMLDNAEQATGEAITLAAARELVPAQARALAVRSCTRGDRYATSGVPLDLQRARDDADHALRLATQHRQLPWQELLAYQAHAHLDRVTCIDRGWQSRAENLRAMLIPSNLAHDPVSNVEAAIIADSW